MQAGGQVGGLPTWAGRCGSGGVDGVWGLAGFLKLAELRYGPLELAGEALAVEAEAGQGFRLAQDAVDDSRGT